MIRYDFAGNRVYIHIYEKVGRMHALVIKAKHESERRRESERERDEKSEILHQLNGCDAISRTH